MTEPLRRRRHHATLAGALAALYLLTACTGGADVDAAGDGGDGAGSNAARTLQPGRPGEAAREVDGPPTMAVAEAWNHEDVMFLQMMIPHHAQALEMSELAKTHARDRAVRALAERIHAAQGPEIRVMASWLEEHGVEVPRAAEDPSTHDHSRHDHAGMRGMLSQAQMQRLADSRGGEFDRLFLVGMIEHHRGALAMVDQIVPDGEDIRVRELADDMAAAQTAEIARMQDVLRSL